MCTPRFPNGWYFLFTIFPPWRHDSIMTSSLFFPSSCHQQSSITWSSVLPVVTIFPPWRTSPFKTSIIVFSSMVSPTALHNFIIFPSAPSCRCHLSSMTLRSFLLDVTHFSSRGLPSFIHDVIIFPPWCHPFYLKRFTIFHPWRHYLSSRCHPFFLHDVTSFFIMTSSSVHQTITIFSFHGVTNSPP